MARTLLCSALAVAAGLCAAAPTRAAEVKIGESGFTWSADLLNSDLRQDTLEASGNVRVFESAMSIESQSAAVADFRSDNSTWTFTDSVRIQTPEANLRSNTARASFVKGRIASARVEGAPAEFERLSEAANGKVKGRAGVIEYDFDAGVVRLRDDVWFSNGKDEFRGDLVIYNVRDERIQINPDGQGGPVRGIIRPNPAPGSSGAAPPPGASLMRDLPTPESDA
jgi:lipopolysaccharide transport protein LptA